MFQKTEKPDIQDTKPDIKNIETDTGDAEPDIQIISSDIRDINPDIKTKKPDIENIGNTENIKDIKVTEADIGKLFRPKTAGHILRLRKAFPDQTVFGRLDVMEVIGLRPSRASELLKELAGRGIIESVSGHGKGKYRFRKE